MGAVRRVGVGEAGATARVTGRGDGVKGRGEGRMRGGSVGEGRGARVEVGRGGRAEVGLGGSVGDGRGGRLGEGRGGRAAVVAGRGLKAVTGRGVTWTGAGEGALVVKEAPAGKLRGSNCNWMVPAGIIWIGRREEGAGDGAWVGAGRLVVEAWNVVATEGPAVGKGLAVVPRMVVGAKVVTAPDGAALSRRLICPPPVMLCCSWVWKVPVFWSNTSWLWN